MRKILLAIALVVCFCASCWGAPLLNADDFMPVVRAADEKERAKLLTVQKPEEVKREIDPVLQKPVTRAATTQDAINRVMKLLYDDQSDGCEAVALSDGSLGVVAVGIGTYGSEMKNIVAKRREQQMAYYIAFLEAKRSMANFFQGASVQQLALFSTKEEEHDEADSGVSNRIETFKLDTKTIISAYLKGYVTYDVRDDFENGTVYVTIVSTLRTQGHYNRPSSITQQAENLSEGINKIFAEIQSGVVPPVGGRIVDVPETGEIAFVGFGSEVVRPSDNKKVRAVNRKSARRRASLRAQASLCGIIMGEKLTAEDTDLSKSGSSNESYIGERKIDLSDPIDELTSDAQKKEAQKDVAAFQSDGNNDHVIKSAIKGTLPPGVTPRAWLNDEGTFAYAVAVYVPSVTKMAAQMSQKMEDAQIVQPYKVKKNVPEDASSENKDAKEIKIKNKNYKDSGTLQPGISGIIEQPL